MWKAILEIFVVVVVFIGLLFSLEWFYKMVAEIFEKEL